MDYCGFVHPEERTYLNARGKLIVKGHLQIGKGCRFDIGPDAVAEFGSGYVGPDTTFIIAHRLSVGSGCAISWGCQFLDESFHLLNYPSRSPKPPGNITIGDNVWIGSKVAIMKGAVIPNGSVIASGTRISSAFTTPNCLIDGNPPQVVKEHVTWN
jgi:acetyltransferase-like isoleucine patch superfamily enzyme